MTDLESSDVSNQVQGYELPPAGFDAQVAPAGDFGDMAFRAARIRKKEPELTRLWQRAFARTPRFQMVTAEVPTDPSVLGRYPKRTRRPDFDPNQRAGAVVPTHQPANLVFAEFVAPHHWCPVG